MITVLTGENSFLLHAEVQELASSFVGAHGDMALERIDGEAASLERIRDSLQSPPFLAERKMVVLRSPSSQKQFVEQAEALLSGLPETTQLVIVEPKLDKRGSYYKFLKKMFTIREFAHVDEVYLSAWLVDFARMRGAVLKATEAKLLIERIGTNQQLLAQEVEKLALYDSQITRVSVELLTDLSPQSSIFELVEAAFTGKTARALELYADQRAQKVDTAQLIAMFTWQLRVLAFLKAARNRPSQEIASVAKLNPFVVRKTQPLAARLTLGDLKMLTTTLLAIDMRSKRERIDVDEALQNFLMMVGGFLS